MVRKEGRGIQEKGEDPGTRSIKRKNQRNIDVTLVEKERDLGH